MHASRVPLSFAADASSPGPTTRPTDLQLSYASSSRLNSFETCELFRFFPLSPSLRPALNNDSPYVDTAQDIATLSSSSLAECGTRLLVPHSSIVIFFIKFSSYLRVTPVTPNPCSLLAPTPTAPAVDCTDTFRYCPSLS
ncbi:hypothetical protein FB45DRAFT_1052624 [Roridomyces roridus]|uniref:Uncharacterized protein n=1 Tax=Roridomyces roridus TaxID=1738132 RepID=A0AAD7CAG3_9AGAR|nr:hypothetical protein FB45DRAFT_1052624 [Roridomyces roridus]